MNLPKNIHKTDGAIARSFSRELGLNLDFKTNREPILHNQESAGYKGYFLTKNGKIIIASDMNMISLFDFSSGNLIKTFPLNKRLHQCFKIDEQTIMIYRGICMFSFLNIDKGFYDDWDLSDHNYRTYDIAFDPGLNWLALEAPKKTIDFYNVKTKTLEKQLDISAYNEYIDTIDFINEGRYLVIRIKRQLLILNAHNLTLLYNINLGELAIENFQMVNEIKDGNALLESHYGGLHWIDLQTSKVKKSANFTMYNSKCNLFKWGSKYLVRNESIGKDDKVTSLKLIDAITFKTDNSINLINNSNTLSWTISICNNYAIALTSDRKIAVYNKELRLVKKIELAQKTDELDGYHSSLGWFIYYDLFFNIKTEQVYKARYDKTRLYLLHGEGDFRASNFQVYLLKDKLSPRQRKLLFVNLKTNEHHVFQPQVQNKQINKIGVKYLAHLNLWLLYYAGHMTVYNADTQSIVKDYNADDLPTMPGNHWNWIIHPKCSLGPRIYDYSAAKGVLKMFNVKTRQTAQKTFGYSWEVSDLHCGENYARKLIESPKRNVLFLLEAFHNNDANEKQIWLSEFDADLNLLRKQGIIIDNFEYINSDFDKLIGLDEENDRLIITGKKTGTKKMVICSLDLDSLKSKIINEIECDYFRTTYMDLSKDGKFLSLYIKTYKEIHLLNLSTNQWHGKIEKVHWEYSFRGFDEVNNLYVVGKSYHTSFYRLDPFEFLGNLNVEPGGKFNISLTPDQTSPNGWFYTNAPEKVGVLKTKADGTEPELLPLDDDDRQTFIKHHNRKDIVMKKLFEPEEYAEFTRLNNGAEEIAQTDMAIELGKVEAKKLEKK